MASNMDANPAGFDDRECIHSIYTVDGRNVVALVHDEYQGNRHGGQCPSDSYQRCWYNTITLATSEDGGLTYTQQRGAGKLVASIPYRYAPDVGPVGMFSPSNIVRNPRDGYYYALVRVIAPGSSVRGTCVMRTRNLFRADTWRAWNGTSFSLKFVDPYLRREILGDAPICTPVGHDEIGEMTDSLTYNTYLDRFLLVGVSRRFDVAQQKTVWGILLLALR